MISERTARSTLRRELTFLVSVRVPHSPPGRFREVFDVAAQGALLHAHVRDAERAQEVAQLGHVDARHLGRPSAGAGTGLVTISTSGMPARL